jgi:hypothetical protein
MNRELQAPGRITLPALPESHTLSVGKALAISFSLAIGLAAIFVAAGVLLSR